MATALHTVCNHPGARPLLDPSRMIIEDVQNNDDIDACQQEISKLVRRGPMAWAFQNAPESDVGILLNSFSPKPVVLYPFRLLFRMFSQTSPKQDVLHIVQEVLGADYESRFGYPDTQWERNGVIYVETAVFNANLKVAKGIRKNLYPIRQQEIDQLDPYKATCANINFSRKLAQAVGPLDNYVNIFPAFRDVHPQSEESIADVVEISLGITPHSIDLIVGRQDPEHFVPGLHYAIDVYSNRFLADKSWNKKLSALVKAAYWAHARREYFNATGFHA